MTCFVDDSDFFRRMGEGWERSLGDYRSFIIGLIVIISLVAVGLAYYFFIMPIVRRRRRARELFDSLCSVNDLHANESRLLMRIARKLRVENPAVIFVRPSLMEKADAMHEFPSEEIVSLKVKLYS